MSIEQELLFKNLLNLGKMKGWDTSGINTNGMCRGLSVVYGYMRALGKGNYFFDTFEKFAAWDGQPDTLAANIERSAEILFNASLWIQRGRNYISMKRKKVTEKSLKVLTGSDNIDFPQMKQKFLMSYPYIEEQLKITLQKILLDPKQITLIESSGAGHAIEVSVQHYPALNFTLYDSEYKKGPIQTFGTLDELVSAIIKATFFKINKTADFTFLSLEEETPIDDSKGFPLIIEVLSSNNNIFYPPAIDLTKEFVDANNINQPSMHDGTTPLHLAALCGDLAAVNFLLTKNANTNSKDHLGKTPFIYAVEGGDLEVVKELHKATSQTLTTNLQISPLSIAANLGYLDIVQYLFDNKIDNYFIEPQKGFFPLIPAIQYGRIEIVKYLITEKKIPVDQKIFVDETTNFTPLYLAAARGQLEIVRFLLNRGANIDKNISLEIAAQNGHLAVVKLLCENGANINVTNEWCSKSLYLALRYHHFDIVKYLLSQGEKTDQINSDGENLTHLFAKQGNIEAVKFLTEQTTVSLLTKEIPSLLQSTYKTLIKTEDFDQEGKLLRVLGFLIKTSADSTKSNDTNPCETLFQQAVTDGKFEIVKKILEYHHFLNSSSIIMAYNIAIEKDFFGIQAILENHPIIAFIQNSQDKIATLKKEYADQLFLLKETMRNKPASIQDTQNLQQLKNYCTGLDKLIKSLQENPLTSARQLIKEISEFNETISFSKNFENLLNEIEISRLNLLEKNKIKFEKKF